MTEERLLELCDMLYYGVPINDNNKNDYADAIEAGYVEVLKPKRATKFFLTDLGKEAIQPVMYQYLYRKFYFLRGNDMSEEDLERYHRTYPSMDGWELMIQFYKDKVNEYDGNKKQRPPRAYIQYIAQLCKHSGKKEEALRNYLVICILDLSGILEIPTQETMDSIGKDFEPGGMFYRTPDQIKDRAQLAPGIVAELRDLCNDSEKLEAIFQEVYSHINLPLQYRSKEEMIEALKTFQPK